MASGDPHSLPWSQDGYNDKNFMLHGRAPILVIIIFSLIIFFSLICFYAKWVCRYQQMESTGTNGHIPFHLPSSARSTGLDSETISKFPVHIHKLTEDEIQCSICISHFQDQEKIKVLPSCKHSFHSECVDPWLSTQSSCPLCRSPLTLPEP